MQERIRTLETERDQRSTMRRKSEPRIFILCSQSGSGLGWPESAHADLGAARAAAEMAAGHPLGWIEDPDHPGTWYTKDLLDDWMIREVDWHRPLRTCSSM
jgi:hypothetical protein